MSASYQTIQSQQIHIHSGQASTYANTYSNSNININFGNFLNLDRHTYEVKLSVVNAQIPYSFYQLNSTNNKLNVIINGITIAYYFTQGNYNINTFITMLLGILPSGFSISFNNATSKLTFSNSLNAFSFSDDVNSIFPLLGFSQGSIYSSYNGTIIAPNCYNLNPLTRLHIYSDNLFLGNVDTFNKSTTSILASIPINCIPNDTIFFYNCNNFRNNMVNPTSILNLNLEIMDDYENPINFNGLNWTLTLQLDVLREIVVMKKDMLDIYEEETQNLLNNE